MSAETIQQIIGRAIAEEPFRELLFSNPDQALAGFDLTGDEIVGLKGLKREEFDAAAGDLEQRISKSFMGVQIAPYFGMPTAQQSQPIPEIHPKFLKLG